MSLSFDQIPSRLRIPGVFIEQTAKLASSGDRLNNVLHLGYARGGNAEQDVIYKVTDTVHAKELFGEYSILTEMADRHFALNNGLTLDAAAIKPPTAQVYATGSIGISTAATADSLLTIRIADQVVSAELVAGDSTEAIATALAAAINAAAGCLVSAVADADIVELTASLPGLLGNDISLVTEYYREEALPVEIIVDSMSGGTGKPDLSVVLDSMGEDYYDYLVTPFTDGASLTVIDEAVEQRWHAMAGFNVETLVIYAIADTFANTVATGKLQNSPFLIPHAIANAPQAPWIWAASVCAIESDSLTNDPAAPLTGKEVPGLKAPKECWNWEKRNELLYSGMSTFTSDRAGNVYLEKVITSYQTDSQGLADASYLSINVPELMRNIRRVQSAYLASVFKGFKLTDYPDQHPSGHKITGVDGIRAALIGFYKQNLIEDRAWCTDSDHYKDTLIVERDTDSRTRVNYSDEPVMIGQLETIAGKSELQHG